MTSKIQDHRRAMAVWLIPILTIFVGGPADSSAADYRSIQDFREVATVVAQYAEQFGPEHVLLVLDIDNTILVNDHVLGSEQWFDWQDYLLKNEPQSPHLVAKSWDGLLNASGLLYELGRMHPTQPDLPAIVSDVQGRGVASIVLTSRGHEFRAATERELTRNGYHFEESGLPVRNDSSAPYMPYDPAEPAKAGLSPEEITAWDLSTPRSVSYQNGVMMTAGQHKGAMLVTLLAHSEQPIKAVVFVDNRPDNDAAVFAALSRRQMEVNSLVYGRADQEIEAFQYGDKTAVTRHWCCLKRTSAYATLASHSAE